MIFNSAFSRFVVFALVLASLSGLPHGAEARIRHGGIATGASPTAPILTDTSYTYGQQSPAFQGVVRLSQQDFTSPSFTPFTVSGLGLMSPGGPACDTWYETFVSGRSSTDFAISATIAEGTNAYTPLLTSTGHNNLTGDYVFHYQCSKNGVMSNVATLTIHTVANEVNFSQYDATNFNNGNLVSSGFGSAAGSKLVISTGADLHAMKVLIGRMTLGSTNANRLIITIADSGRYPYVSNLQTYNLSNIDVTGIIATGNTVVVPQNDSDDIFGSFYTGVPTSNETWENLTYYGSMLMMPSVNGNNSNSEQAFIGANGCATNCLIQNSQGDFVASGFQISENLTATNVDIGHFDDNCTAFNSLNTGATLTNISCHDFVTPYGGLHLDCMQSLDGATGYNITVKGFWCLQAGGMTPSQMLWFGGFQGGEASGTCNPWQGYVDDGTGTHGPGTKLTLTSGCLASSSYGAIIWTPTAGAIAISDNVRLGQNGGSTAIPLLNIAATNIGSPGSPVTFSNIGMYNAQMEGLVNVGQDYHGLESVGESGTSFYKHFAAVQQNFNPYGYMSFNGKIEGAITSPYSGSSYASGVTMTITSAPSKCCLSMFPSTFQAALNYSGCPASPSNAYCSLAQTGTGGSSGLSVGGQGWSNEPVSATGTASITCCASIGSNTYSQLVITGPCTGRWDTDISNGSPVGGLMVDGSGIPDYLYIQPTLGLPSDGCAGTYTLSRNIGSIAGPIAAEGRRSQLTGNYGLYNYGTGATPTGAVAMTTTQYVGIPNGSLGVSNQTGGCTAGLHTGTFTIAYGYASGGVSGCTSRNTTLTSIITPVAADFATGILPETSLTNTTSATWDAMDTGGGSTQKKAYVCNKMLPKVGGALDLGGGNFAGPFTATGELQLASGNVAITGCGVH